MKRKMPAWRTYYRMWRNCRDLSARKQAKAQAMLNEVAVLAASAEKLRDDYWRARVEAGLNPFGPGKFIGANKEHRP